MSCHNLSVNSNYNVVLKYEIYAAYLSENVDYISQCTRTIKDLFGTSVQ